MEPRAAKRTYDAQLDLHRTRMTQRRASTPDILVYHSSPSRHRVGNRLPPRGELSPAGKQEGETIERRKKIVAKKKSRRRSMSNSPTPAMREFPVVVEGESAIPPNEGSGRHDRMRRKRERD